MIPSMAQCSKSVYLPSRMPDISLVFYIKKWKHYETIFHIIPSTENFQAS